MARQKTEVSTYKNLLLRLPEEMLEACRASAKKERRSLNAQLLILLEHSLEKPQERAQHACVPSGGPERPHHAPASP
jgi:hypothetical protein